MRNQVWHNAILSAILRLAEGDGSPSGGTGGGSGATGAPGAGSNTPEGDKGKEASKEDLGRAGGEDSLKSELAEERKRRQAAEEAQTGFTKQLTDALSALTGKKSEEAPSIESLLAQLTELKNRDSERETASNQRLIRTEVRRIAGTLNFHDVADALGQVGIAEFKVGEDGEVESAPIEEALKKLAESKPYLVKKDIDATASMVGVGSSGGEAPAPRGKQRLAAHYNSKK